MQATAISRRFHDTQLPVIVAAAAVVIATSLFYTRIPFVILLAIPFCAYFATRPYKLLLVMVFLIPFNFVFEIGSLPVAAELLKVAAWVPFLITWHERETFVSSRFNKLFAVMAVLIVLSLIRAKDLPYTLKECVRLGSNLGLVYLCLNLVDSRDKVMQMFRVLTVSTFLVACYGFYQWAIQDYGALFWIVNPRLDTNLAHYRDYFWDWRNRIVSVLTSEMELGHYFNLCIPIGVMLWFTDGARKLTSKWLLMTASMLAGLVLTFTFGAWFALAVTFAIFAVLTGAAKRWKVILGGLAVLLLIAALVAYGPLHSVVEAKASGTAAGSFAWDVMTRLYGWKLALQMWWSHPLLGAGIGGFESYSSNFDFVLGAFSQGSTPHETYFYMLANYGLVGTLAILTILVRSIRSNLSIMRSGTELSILGLALAFCLTSNMIGWLGDDSGFLGPHASYLLWLLIGTSEVISRFPQRASEPMATSA